MGRASSSKKQRRLGEGGPSKKWIVPLLAWGLIKGSLAHGQDQLVSGNLTVSGSGDINGGLQLGISSGTAGSPGLNLNYVDGYPTSVSDQIQFVASRSQTSWLWLYTTSGNAIYPQMWLDDANVLTLYDHATVPIPGIQLNPIGTSIFNQALIVKGSDNRMPNQILADPSSVLTEGLADGRYVKSGEGGIVVEAVTFPGGAISPVFALPGGSATGSYSFAGINATASGSQSIAIGVSAHAYGIGSIASGFGSTASGAYSVAGGSGSVANGWGAVANGHSAQAIANYSSADGFGSIASGICANALGAESSASGYFAETIGPRSSASGYFSVAEGVNSQANGAYSVTVGANAIADGDYSVGASPNVHALGLSQFVLGQFNVTQGDGHNWIATDDLFQIGNGIDGAHPSNAFTVKKNGDTAVNGAMSVAGDSSVAGTLSVSKLVVQHLDPQGNLSMGPFTAEQ